MSHRFVGAAVVAVPGVPLGLILVLAARAAAAPAARPLARMEPR